MLAQDLLKGDFYGIIYLLVGEDKFGGRTVNINRALRFQVCLDTYKMIDIGFFGAHYTWSNNRPLT